MLVPEPQERLRVAHGWLVPGAGLTTPMGALAGDAAGIADERFLIHGLYQGLGTAWGG
jgi:hypothetical protein